MHAFRLCLGRRPSAREQTLLSGLLKKQTEAFREHPEDAAALRPLPLASRERKRPEEVDASEFAAWTMLARVLLNLDEFITRE